MDIVPVATSDRWCVFHHDPQRLSSGRPETAFVSYTPEFSFQSNSRSVILFLFYYCHHCHHQHSWHNPRGVSCQLVEATLHWTMESVLCVYPPPVKATVSHSVSALHAFPNPLLLGTVPSWKLLGGDSVKKDSGREKQVRDVTILSFETPKPVKTRSCSSSLTLKIHTRWRSE